MAKQERFDPFTIRIADLGEVAKRLDFDIGSALLAELLGRDESVYSPGSRDGAATLMISAVGENVFIKGHIEVQVDFECGRCLAKRTRVVEVPLDWSFLPEERYREAAAHDEIELTAEDLDVSFYSGGEIDLRAIVAEAIVLSLEPYPNCESDCEVEGEAVAKASENVDLRWLPLLEMTEKKAN
jgi:uncharacterized protein